MRSHRRFSPALALFALFLIASPISASYTQRQKITSTPRGVGAQFANAIAVSGNTMVVGARFDSTTASQTGAAFVYVFTGGTWAQQAVLLANDGTAGDKFGESVAISGETIVVGGYNDDAPLANSGSAYVFVRTGTTWAQQQKITANDGTAADEFGNAVGIFGNTIVVGAHFADLPGNSESGSAYVFRRSGTVWSQNQRLVPVSPVPLGDHFGESLSLPSNGLLAIGASGDDSPQTAAGAVYVLLDPEGDGFTHSQKLNITSGTNGDRFGNSVATDGTTLVAGAREDTIGGQTASGSAYVFDLIGGSWTFRQQLVANDGASFDRFGWSVAVNGGAIAVGAREDDTGAGPDTGSAYLFSRIGTTWSQSQKIIPTDTFNGDRFGAAVAFHGSTAIVGAAEKALTSPNGQGAAYTFFPPSRTQFDYDGDNLTDISIFRPSNGQWWYQRSSDNGVTALQFGIATDKPMPADYDGDGKTDIAIFRPSTGEWFVLRSSNMTFYSAPFGVSTDKPAPGDYDGDGFADIAVFRPSEGTWYINKSSGGTQISQWGGAGDLPVNADYDGDGKSDVAIFRPADGSWWLNRSTSGIYITVFGVSTDKPVRADYSGDGKADVAVWRPSNGSWYVLRSEDPSFYAAPFGANGDIPAAGDYDGDGRADLAVFRPDGANWFIQRSTAGILIQQFGANGDTPTPAAFIP